MRHFVLVLALFAMGHAAADETPLRLLPGEATQALRLSWKQDGRAFDVTLANTGPWLVRELSLELKYQPEPQLPIGPASASKRAKPSALDIDAGDRWLAEVLSREVVKLPVNVMPGKTGAAYLELSSSRKITEAVVVEAKGRQLTRIERLRAALF